MDPQTLDGVRQPLVKGQRSEAGIVADVGSQFRPLPGIELGHGLMAPGIRSSLC